MKTILCLLLVATPLLAFTQGDQQEIARKGAAEIHVNAYLVVTIPANMKITAESLYGGIVAKDVKDMPMVKSVYGEIEVVFAADARINGLDYESDYQNVDVTLPTDIAANLKLGTNYGDLYTDFDFTALANGTDKRDNKHDHGQGDHFSGVLNGGGATISLTSPYKDVYLRKRKE